MFSFKDLLVNSNKHFVIMENI